MTVKEAYDSFGGDYEDVFSRLMKDERIFKYLNKFANGNDLALMKEAFDNKNYEEAFRQVHNLKGLSLNLGLSALFEACDVLCEEVRHGAPANDVTSMIENVSAAYDRILNVTSNIDMAI